MGFPKFYGMNMDAWIDCMSDIGGGMTSSKLNTSEPICIEFLNAEDFNKRTPEMMHDLINCVTSVNQHFSKTKEDKYLVLKFL